MGSGGGGGAVLLCLLLDGDAAVGIVGAAALTQRRGRV